MELQLNHLNWIFEFWNSMMTGLAWRGIVLPIAFFEIQLWRGWAVTGADQKEGVLIALVWKGNSFYLNCKQTTYHGLLNSEVIGLWSCVQIHTQTEKASRFCYMKNAKATKMSFSSPCRRNSLDNIFTYK